MVREKRDTNPALFKFGVAIAISLGGVFYSIFRTRNMKPPRSPSTASSSGFGKQVDSEGMKTPIEDELQVLDKSYDSDSASAISEKQEDASTISRSYTKSGDKDRILLPEFDELVKEFDPANKARVYICPEKDVETPYPCDYEFECTKREEYEEVINNLNSGVEFLQKRVSTLETELLKYYGLKEQENTVAELQNRVKIHNTEAKLFSLKINALQSENDKLKAQSVDYRIAISELEAAKMTIKLLTKRLKAETEQNKEQMSSLQQRVKKMQDEEMKAISGHGSCIGLKMQRLNELEVEAEELRRSNHSLGVENSELAQKLEHAQSLATSLQVDPKVGELKEETHRLRQQNEDLSKQVEQLQSSWCVDIEELVYLRWVNACLRYELRNYQPKPGTMTSRDLSRTLSPKSEKKAKQLIMEYANKQGLEEKGRHIADLDFDRWSYSQSSHSCHSDGGEIDDDSSFDHLSAGKTDTSSKRRIFGKLRRLLRGEDDNNNNNLLHDNQRALGENGDGDTVRRTSLGSERYITGTKTDDLKELDRRRRYSDLGFPRVYKGFVFTSENGGDLRENQLEEKSKLAKYAVVLKDSSRENPKLHRRAVSHS